MRALCSCLNGASISFDAGIDLSQPFLGILNRDMDSSSSTASEWKTFYTISSHRIN